MTNAEPSSEDEHERNERMAALHEMFDKFGDVVPFTRPKTLPGGYPANLFEPVERVEIIAQQLYEGAKIKLRQTGGQPPTAYVFCTRDPLTSKPGNVLISLEWTNEELINVRSWKNAFSLTTRILGLAGRARAVCVLSEVWLVTTEEKGRVRKAARAVEARRRDLEAP